MDDIPGDIGSSSYLYFLKTQLDTIYRKRP
jgi:hypothetical protein